MYNDTQHDYTWLSDVVESSACLEIVQRRHKTLNCNRGIHPVREATANEVVEIGARDVVMQRGYMECPWGPSLEDQQMFLMLDFRKRCCFAAFAGRHSSCSVTPHHKTQILSRTKVFLLGLRRFHGRSQIEQQLGFRVLSKTRLRRAKPSWEG